MITLLRNYPDHRQHVNAQKYVFIQPKLDGWRAYINTFTGRIYSRGGNEIILPHITEEVLSMRGLPDILDGEIYTHGHSLIKIQSMIAARDTRLNFNAFDCIIPGNFSWRLRRLEAIKETAHVRTVKTYKINPSQIDAYYREYLSMGLEGAVIRTDSRYEAGRSENVLKMKPIYDAVKYG